MSKSKHALFMAIKEDIECAYQIMTAHQLAVLLIRNIAPDSGIKATQLCDAMDWDYSDTFVFDFEGN